MLLTGADILVKTLIEQKCDVVFGYPGGQILNVYDSLYKYKDEIRHILTAHEQGAAHAADGYARSTGKVGVVIATSGPGATNLVTGIATAHLDSVPMVAITGNVATDQIGNDSFQEIDITGITLPITKHNFFVDDISELADTVREAFTLASSGRKGPVLIDIPKDVQTALYEYEPEGKFEKNPPFAAKEIRIKEAAKTINKAKKPFIYFGGGLLSSDAKEEMLTLAEKIDAPIGCSLMGLSALPKSHPRFLGMQGMHGQLASSLAMHEADLIIALGARFSERVVGRRDKFSPNAKIVHIDIDGAELSKILSTEHSLRGDIKETLKGLIPLVRTKKCPEWNSEVSLYKEKEASLSDKREGMTPKNIIEAVNRIKTPDTPVATDVGQHQMWTAQYLDIIKERTFLTSGGLGTMGFGFGAAIGASIGTGERSILVTGDGSFGMSLNELATAVTNKIPVVILIMNNGVLGMVRQWQTLFFDKHYSETELKRATDFSAVAKAFGAEGEKVSDLAGLEKALRKGFETEGPYVIDCMVDKDEFVLPMLPPGGSVAEIITKKEK